MVKGKAPKKQRLDSSLSSLASSLASSSSSSKMTVSESSSSQSGLHSSKPPRLSSSETDHNHSSISTKDTLNKKQPASNGTIDKNASNKYKVVPKGPASEGGNAAIKKKIRDAERLLKRVKDCCSDYSNYCFFYYKSVDILLA